MANYLIKKKTAVKLFKALGFVTAKNWTTERLQSKLNNLPEIADEAKNDEWVRDRLKRIEKADEVIIKVKDEEVMAKKKKKKKVAEEEVVTKKSKKKDKKVDKKKGKKKVTKPEAKKSKKAEKKKVEKKISAKELVYRCFEKLKNTDKALDHVDKWIKETKVTVQKSTVKSWIGQWKNGKNLPACAKKK